MIDYVFLDFGFFTEIIVEADFEVRFNIFL